MQKTIQKLICTCLVLTLLLSAAPIYANIPAQRFLFVPIAYEGEILDAMPCSEGLFSVKNESFKSGFIATDGTLKIPFEYANAGSFTGSFAPAAVANGKYGYISKDGLFEIAPAFDSAQDFAGGLALVEKDARAYFIDQTGKAVDFAYTAEYTPVSNFTNGGAWVIDQDGMFRFLKADGNFLNDTRYLWAAKYSDGVCWVSPESGNDFLDFDMQLIDQDGNVLIERGLYTSATAFHEGLCWAKRTADMALVLIDKQGNIVFEVKNAEGIPTPYANGISIGMENGLFTVWNTEGTVIFSSLYYRAVSYGGFSEGCMLVQDTRNEQYYIMQDTAYIAPEKSDTAYRFTHAKEPLQSATFEIALCIGSPLAIVNGEKMYIDAANLNVKAYTANGRTLVPMRFLSENLPGWSITWDYLTESAVLKSDTLSASFKTGTTPLEYIQFNAAKKQYDYLTKPLDQPPVISDGRMFLPVRALSELMGVNVFYDERGLVVFSNTRNTLTYEDATQLLTQFE